MRKRSTIALAVLVMLLGLTSSVWAETCPQGSSPEWNRRLAAETFDQGQALFDAGDYRAALERFQCSYGLVPHHNTLFNMGECAVELGDLDAAIRYFRTYVETFPDQEARAEVEARLRELEARQAAAAAPPVGQPVVETASVEEPTPPPAEEQPPPAEPPRTRMTTARRLAWVTLGVGAGLAIVGGGVFGGAASNNADFIAANDEAIADGVLDDDERAELDDQSATGEAMETAGWALMGVGLASLVASVVIFTAFDGTETVAVAPVVLAVGGGLGVAGRF